MSEKDDVEFGAEDSAIPEESETPSDHGAFSQDETAHETAESDTSAASHDDEAPDEEASNDDAPSEKTPVEAQSVALAASAASSTSQALVHRDEIDSITLEPISELDPDPEGLIAIKNLEARRKRAKRKRIIKIAATCAVAALAIAGFAISNAVSKAAEEAARVPETAVITRGDLTQTVQVTGTLNPQTQVAVTPEVSGIIQEVLVTEGQHVEQGDTLFVLKNTELEKAVADAQSAVNKAAHGVDTAQAGVANAEQAYNDAQNAAANAAAEQQYAYERAQSEATDAYNSALEEALDAIPDSATQDERSRLYDQARQIAQAAYDSVMAASGATSSGGGTTANTAELQSAIDAAYSEVTSAQDTLADAQRSYDYALQEADKRNVKTPSAGTVMAVNAVAGTAVGGASGGTKEAEGPLAYVSDLSSLGVDVEINEVDIAEVNPGQRTTVTFPAIPDLTLEGEVTSVASMASSAGGESSNGGGIVTFKVTTIIKSTDERLKPGMSANVGIITKKVPDVLIAPANAVVEDESGAHVFVVTDPETNETEQRDVTVQDRTNSEVAIKGVQEGEVVLASQPTDDASETDDMSL